MARRTRFDLIREAEVTASAKAKPPAAEKKPTAAKKAQGWGPKSDAARRVGGRMKAVWVVLDPAFAPIATFEYRDRALADQKALDLTQQKGKPHMVRPNRVAMDV